MYLARDRTRYSKMRDTSSRRPQVRSLRVRRRDGRHRCRFL